MTLTGKVTSSIFSGNLIDYFVKVPAIDVPVRVRSAPPRKANAGDDVDLVVAEDQLIPLED